MFCFHKNIVILWQNTLLMAENSSFKAMEAIVERTENGKILIPDDFTLCGTPDSVRSGLTRLCKNGKLNRFAKGIYYIPMYDKWDGTPREPSLDAIAQRIADRDKARIIPNGHICTQPFGAFHTGSNQHYIYHRRFGTPCEIWRRKKYHIPS